MKLEEIAENSAIFTDEELTNTQLLSIANKGISRINTECKTNFPFYEDFITEYTAIPKNWQLDLISNYLSYGIKMNDSALTEADRYLDEFYRVLNSFRDNIGTLIEKYKQGDIENGISSDYINTLGFGGVYGIDTSNAINVGYFGNNSNGGCY